MITSAFYSLNIEIFFVLSQLLRVMIMIMTGYWVMCKYQLLPSLANETDTELYIIKLPSFLRLLSHSHCWAVEIFSYPMLAEWS